MRYADSKDFNWTTNASRTRLSSIEGFGFQSLNASNSVNNLRDVIAILNNLQVPPIRANLLHTTDPIGEGGTFLVKKAEHDGRLVAVKYIKLAPDKNETEHRKFKRRLDCAIREVIIMHSNSLAENSNIPDLLGYGFDTIDGKFCPFIVVEYGDYGCARTFLLARGQQWPLDKKLAVIADICAGLAALHQAGVVHGDLKLENVIMFDAADRPAKCRAKICDFDHSQLIWTESVSVQYTGTGMYLPPEARYQTATPIPLVRLKNCDVWAFGLAVWEVLIGGERYFREEWRRGPRINGVKSLTGTKSPKPSSAVVDGAECPESDPGTEDRRTECEWNTFFGNFDLSSLGDLAEEPVNASCRESSFESAYLTALLRQSLDVNPLDRLSDISVVAAMLYWLAAGAEQSS